MRGKNLAGSRPDGGGSFNDLKRRVVPFFDRIVRETDLKSAAILIIAHAGVNRVILCHVLGMPVANLMRL